MADLLKKIRAAVINMDIKKQLNDEIKKTLISALKASFKASGKRKLSKLGDAPEIPDAVPIRSTFSKNNKFSVGFSQKSILPADIPEKKYYMAGYGNNKLITGVLDDIFAKAVWIDDNSPEGGIVLVAIDCVGLLNEDIEKIRSILSGFKKRTGCRSIDICSTHSHAGIDSMGIYGTYIKSGKDKEFMNILYRSTVRAVESAYANRRIGELYFGQIEVPDLQKDIRTPAVFSKILSRFRFVPDDGSNDVYIMNFAAHAEMLDWHNTLVSGDWPTYMCNKIKEISGADAILFQGAIGGMITLIETGEDPYTLTKMLGDKIGEYAVSIKDTKTLKPEICIVNQKFYIGIDNIIFLIAGVVKLLSGADISKSDTAYYRAKLTEMKYLQIGDVNILMIPGELFPELAYGGYFTQEESPIGEPPEINPEPLIKIANDENLIIFGLANDEVGYIVPPNDYMLNPITPYLADLKKDSKGRKHYEETNSVSRDEAHIIANQFKRILGLLEQD